MDGPVPSFRLAPSRRLLAALCALHLLGLAGLAATALALPARLLLALALLASFAWQARAHLVLARAGGTRLELRDRQWRLECDGVERAVTLCAETTILPFGIVLRLRERARVHTVVVLGDSLAPAALRRLRALLRWHGEGPG